MKNIILSAFLFAVVPSFASSTMVDCTLFGPPSHLQLAQHTFDLVAFSPENSNWTYEDRDKKGTNRLDFTVNTWVTSEPGTANISWTTTRVEGAASHPSTNFNTELKFPFEVRSGLTFNGGASYYTLACKAQ